MKRRSSAIDTNYFETFNRPNVHLVDVSQRPIERLTRRGLVTGGKEYEFDAIVFATGFDAMTGSLLKIDIRGRGGRALRDKWSAGPRTYLGLGVAGFPNLFTISGPGSPSVLTNIRPITDEAEEWPCTRGDQHPSCSHAGIAALASPRLKQAHRRRL